MRVLGIIALCAVVLIVGVIAWWKSAYPTYSYRYRLTIAIEVDGKVHTGSSVIEVAWNGGPEFGDVGSYHPSIRGQATLIDIGPRGVVVAALVNGESYGAASDGALSALWIAARAFGNDSTNNQLRKLPHLAGRRDLAADNMPRLIWFSDIADPNTARKLMADDLPALLGSGARLAAAYVEITRDPIVVDIDKRLPWYRPLRGPPSKVLYLQNGFALGWTMFIGDAS